MRFLTAYCAQLEGQTIILDGVERMHHRPIGQLVDALREIGADIEYLGAEGFSPLRIKGCILDKHRIVTINNPQSTQFVSALLLIGANVQTDSTSPYITLTRKMIEQYALASFTEDSATSVRRSGGNKISSVENKINLDFVSEANRSPIFLERDWSSAAFWYEYVALHGGEITLPCLSRNSLQGDKIVADIFTHLGVQTHYTTEGIVIYSSPLLSTPYTLHQDFASCPDLYPSVALTCEKLGIRLDATGVESLPLKESDRLRAVREHRTDADHRMAMALLIAGFEVDDTTCISKSYPHFLDHFRRINSLKIQET
jgi:3-phosphoshikimate 1-carboxyvinyltransferase